LTQKCTTTGSENRSAPATEKKKKKHRRKGQRKNKKSSEKGTATNKWVKKRTSKGESSKREKERKNLRCATKEEGRSDGLERGGGKKANQHLRAQLDRCEVDGFLRHDGRKGGKSRRPSTPLLGLT